MAHGLFVGRLGLVPRVVLLIEGLVAGPDGEDELEEFAHAMADGNVAALAFGLEPLKQRGDGRVEADGGACRIPQIMTGQIVAFG